MQRYSGYRTLTQRIFGEWLLLQKPQKRALRSCVSWHGNVQLSLCCGSAFVWKCFQYRSCGRQQWQCSMVVMFSSNLEILVLLIIAWTASHSPWVMRYDLLHVSRWAVRAWGGRGYSKYSSSPYFAIFKTVLTSLTTRDVVICVSCEVFPSWGGAFVRTHLDLATDFCGKLPILHVYFDDCNCLSICYAPQSFPAICPQSVAICGSKFLAGSSFHPPEHCAWS